MEAIDSPSNCSSLPLPTHFVMVPFMAQGHLIPAMDIARLLALRGATVTVITTPLNAARLSATAIHLVESGLHVRLHTIPFPCTSFGLPDGCESIDLLPSNESTKPFLDAARQMAGPLREFLLQQVPQLKTCCLVADVCHPWTREVADELGVRRLVLHGTCCFAHMCLHNSRQSKLFDAGDSGEDALKVIPGLAHRVEVTRSQVPDFFTGEGMESFLEEMTEAEAVADGLILNTFEALERWYVNTYRKTKGKEVYTVGPLSLTSGNASSRGNTPAVSYEGELLRWLDAMGPGKVVYVSFGSIAVMAEEQLIEIGMALEALSHPYIWVINHVPRKEFDDWLKALDERIHDRSMIIRGWAPQAAILNHKAIGGFLTHGGWNSTLEGLSAGVPLLVWPRFAEQFLNAKLVVDVLRVGLTMGMITTVANWGGGSQEIVRSTEIAASLRQLMGGGKEAEERRRKAEQLKGAARRAVDVGGSSCENITRIIERVRAKCNA